MHAAWAKAGTVTACAKTLEYTCVGPPPSAAPTLVLLHEGLGCVRLWRDVPAALSEATGFGVFAYSRAGYGQSEPTELPRPLDYMSREALQVLPQLLGRIGVRRAVLVGHSDGATIAAIHAARATDALVCGAVLMAPHFFSEAAGLAEIARAREAFDRGDLREKLSRYHEDVDNAFRGWSDAWLDPSFKDWNVADVLDDIRVPVLAIQGRDDPYGTLAQIDALTQSLRHAALTTLILNNCRHAPHLEQGAAVIAAIAAFAQQSAAATAD